MKIIAVLATLILLPIPSYGQTVAAPPPPPRPSVSMPMPGQPGNAAAPRQHMNQGPCSVGPAPGLKPGAVFVFGPTPCYIPQELLK
jgi:hypothetical protein